MSQPGNRRRNGGSQRSRGRGGGWWRGRSSNRGYGRGRPGNSRPKAVQSVQTTLYDVPSPYKGWKIYFPEERRPYFTFPSDKVELLVNKFQLFRQLAVYCETSDIVLRVKVFENYFTDHRQNYNKEEIEREGHFIVDLKEMLSDTAIQQGIPELSTEIRKSPEPVLNMMGLAMHQMLMKELEDDLTEIVMLPRIHCRVSKFEPVTALKNLKANYYGKFVSIKGTVVRVSNIKPLCTKLAFECNSCFTLQVVTLPDGKFVQPTSCSGAECHSKSFIPKRSHIGTVTVDWQTIRVQEILNDDHRESGRIPRTVDCELMHDLVDCSVPGDQVIVSGIVKVQSSQESSGGGRQKDKCMFLLYIETNYVLNTKGSKTQGQVATGVTMDFTMTDLYAIEEIQAEESLFRLLVQSLCPAIYGHEMVKAGLLLGLLGGTHKFLNDKNHIPVRGDPHILVVGDPGLGKSQMLQAVANIAPRSVYVCGNTTTTSGLTVTLTREGGGSGDYALEAGALVLADQGCCCIDEFDKMGSQHQALLEAMEQQSISIAKAGIVCSLPARTSILAAANPVGGHYNKAKTVSENLRLGSALLSRFDLVFILLDKPDEDMDALLSEHVMAMHTGKHQPGATPSQSFSSLTQEEATARRQWESQKPLSERLKVERSQPALDLIPPPLLRKYVAYARKYVHPKITPEAAQVLQQFYLDLRRQHQTRDSTPITTRQLESLIRLTEARARVELREECTESDARDVVEIMKNSMVDTYSDELGILDFTRSQHGSGMSSRSQSKKFVAALQHTYEQTYNALFTAQELRQIAQQANIKVRDFDEFLASLNNQGFLLKKGPRVYQLQTAGY